jgi:GDP/UDP-N,N'-diacetylbacillosamine 2-epimerase (hydrolysing)
MSLSILFLTGSRGEWGYIRPILKKCPEYNIKYHICATNMHLIPRFGFSVQEIRKDGFEVEDEILMAFEGYDHFAMTKSLGVCLLSLVDVLRRLKPDWIILAGDRGEQLMGAIAGAYTYTPVAHIQAGELSGNIDGMARHAIGKLVHLHFASNEDAAQRLIRLGEESFRVHVVGAPQLDELVEGQYSSIQKLKDKYAIPVDEPFLLIVQHAVTEEFDKAEKQIKATLEAVEQFDLVKIWILPNNDAGSEIVRESIIKNRKGRTFIFKNMPREDYLGLLASCRAIVGNSSSGLLEAPTFSTPAVNIGRRQFNRVRGKNVIDVDEFKVEQIIPAIRKAISSEFRDTLEGMTNPYGDGKSAERILDILINTPLDSKLLTKRLTY